MKKRSNATELNSELMMKTLDNGLKIVWIVEEGTKLVNVEFMTKCGSDAEGFYKDDYALEAAHAIEHLIAGWASNEGITQKLLVNDFSGLEQYGFDQELIDSISSSSSADNFLQSSPAYLMAKLLDSAGIITNASTEDEMTRYWLRGMAKYQVLMAFIAALLLKNPLVEDQIYTQELNAAINELTAVEEGLWYPLEEEVNQYCYAGTSRAKGEKERIKNLEVFIKQKKRLPKLLKKWYSPENIVVFLCGDLEMENGVPKIVYIFEQLLKNNKKVSRKRYIYPCAKKHPNYKKFISVPIPGSLTKLTFVYNLNCTIFDLKDMAILNCLAWVLEEGFSGRIIARLRTELGVIYDVRTESLIDFVNGSNSNFRVSMECEEDNTSVTIKEIIEITEKLISGMCHNIKSWEFKKWKENKERLHLSFINTKTPEKYSLHYGKYLVHSNNRPIPTEEDIFNQIQNISIGDVSNYACKLFSKPVIFSSVDVKEN